MIWLPLAHHRPGQLDRCIWIPLGNNQLALCARCLGLYPTMGLLFLLQGWQKWGSFGAADWWWSIGGAIPALIDWGLGWLDHRSGKSWLHFLTGILLGLALGRSFWLYFHDPRCEIFWVQMGVLGTGALAFEAVRRLHL